jgi:hypothetical protein
MHDADGWVKKDFVPFGSVSVGRPKNFTRDALLEKPTQFARSHFQF